jgi:hypothetical protein
MPGVASIRNFESYIRLIMVPSRVIRGRVGVPAMNVAHGRVAKTHDPDDDVKYSWFIWSGQCPQRPHGQDISFIATVLESAPR